MERSDPGTVLDSSIGNRRFRSRPPSASLQEKWNNVDSGAGSEVTCKRIKTQELDPVLCSKGIKFHHLESPTLKEATVHADIVMEGETCQMTEILTFMSSDRFREGTTGQGSLSLLELAGHVDTSCGLPNNSTCDTTSAYVTEASNNSSVPKKPEKDLDLNISTSSGFGVDLNAVYVSNIVEQDPFYPYKRLDNVKSKLPSECGSSTGPLEESEPLRKWKEMKQNGFISASHGGIPIPKQRSNSRKNKNNALKRKIELAKKEQVNRFAKMAAPSGLLTGLNPGIINHVRNGKQVQSIIEALVRSEKLDSHIQNRPINQTQMKRGGKEVDNRKNCRENMHDSGTDEPSKILPLSRETREDPTSLYRLPIPSSMEHKGRGGELDAAGRRIYFEPSVASYFTSECEDSTLKPKLSSTETVASENASCASSEELMVNQENINSLSVKAATVAFRWLELLQQDIRGRLTALRRSRKRLQNMIQRELASLMLNEFLLKKENDPNFSQSSSAGCSNNTSPDMHMRRWRSLFSQMDKALSEEGKHLETWLGQVKEMQLHCEQGLQYVNIMGIDGLQHPGLSEKDTRSKKAEAAVRAAAASIYSTCNLAMAAENVSCF